MNCPYCDFHFKVLASNAATIPDNAPVLCESCSQIGYVQQGRIRKLSEDELESLKKSPVYSSFLAPAIELIDRIRKAKNARNN